MKNETREAHDRRAEPTDVREKEVIGVNDAPSRAAERLSELIAPDAILETTLATDFAPASNLKDGVAGANWSFLLPRLELEQIICFGLPADPALATLARIGRNVVIVCSSRSQARRVESAAVRLGSGGRIQACLRPAAHSLEDGSADLIVAEGRRANVAELRRLIRPGGLVYARPALASRLELAGSDGETARLFAVSPRLGEVQNAAPAEDRAMLDYLLGHPAYCPSFRRGVFKRAHRAASRRWLLSPLTRRKSALGGGGDVFPAYLREIAAKAGIDLDGRRFGLSARGRYNSRKVLFLIFERAGQTLEYIVKITREPALNGRLENEHRVLELLEEVGAGEPGTRPRAAFFGYHGGLAVLGETFLDGRPFHLTGESPAASPALRAAVDWLVELGVATAAPADPREVSGRLGQLLARFVEVYRPGQDIARFLAAQVEAIARSRSPFPLAFQHGDPHTGNILVTSGGRVAFLDWEAAELRGMPLWDVFYFMRGCANLAARASGEGDALAGFRRFCLAESELGGLLADAVRTTCERTGLAGELVEPLLHTCWMQRALKEAMRLPAERLGRGRFLDLLHFCVAEREAPGLMHIFSAAEG